MRIAASTLALALQVCIASNAQAEKSAFPGAFGYGANATGWRNGEVIYVSTLDDTGPGSLRDCVERDAPRICVFSVSGTIELDSELKIGPDVYIAGQTAPGQGIQLRLRDGFRSPVLIKNSNDVVIRFLKVRPGAAERQTPSVDAITIENSKRVYIDHLSLMFATDELLNVHVSGGVSGDITVANSILAFGLEDANHPNGRHSKGALICSHEGNENQCGRITLARNLFAHNRDRNPDLKGTDLGPIELINNVFYNFGSQNGEFYDFLGNLGVNYIGNVSIAGPDSRKPPPAMIETITSDGETAISVFADDNRVMTCPGGETQNVLNLTAETTVLDAPSGEIVSPVRPSSETLEMVLASVGDQIDTRRAPDAIDQMVIFHVKTCDGRIIDQVDDIGGWTEIESLNAESDRDGDGLPDDWERRRPWLDPDNPDDAQANMPASGYSNIEFYLASRAGDI